MRHRSTILIVAVMALSIAGSANASIVHYVGTLSTDVGRFPPLAGTSAGVATINGSSGGSHLTMLMIRGASPGHDTVAVTDPLVTAAGLISLRVHATIGSGTLGRLSTQSLPLTQRTLSVMGTAALCLAANCGVAIAYPMGVETANGEWLGIGVGGLLTVGGYVGIRLSLERAPWTIKTRTLWTWGDNLTTMGGQTMMTMMQAGFRHGPSSNATSTAIESGVVSFISPQTTLTEGIAGNNQHLAIFTRMTIHFIPEPGMLLLLGSGIAGLLTLGRARMRR